MKADLLVSADLLEERGHEGHSLLRREPVFITGSRVYGVPRYDSDIDIVTWVSETDLELLKRRCDRWKTMRNSTSIHIGILNLICVNDYDTYQKWREGTDKLIAMKPITKEQAIAVFASLLGGTAGDQDPTMIDYIS